MAITLGALALPSGLVWTDELTWTPVMQSQEYSLTGALLIQVATKLAGRPITLTGQASGRDYTAWITRADLLTLKAALDVPGATFTLTLHDARTFTVMAAENPLDVEPLPIYGSFAPANPTSAQNYVLKALKLIEV